jgi:hypothetical protein
MTTRRLSLAIAAFALSPLAASVTACGGSSLADDCATVCQAQNSCPGDAKDCDAYCAALVAVGDASGCSDTIQTDVDCVGTQADVCSLAGACSDEGAASDGCIGTYCGQNPNDEGCAALTSS